VLGAPEKGANEGDEILGLRLALIEEKMGEVDAKLFQIARLLGDSNVVPMTRTAAFQLS